MDENILVADINEAVHILETYHLTSLIWRFEECPLTELKHYVPKGREELVVVGHKDDKYIPYRLVFEPSDDGDSRNSIITLKFHEEWHMFIILGIDKGDTKVDEL
jgi:hypothetical protein